MRKFCLHLERRDSSFYWRRRLPRFVRLKGGTNHSLTHSLRTLVVPDAEEMARRLTRLSSSAFEFMKGVPAMDQAPMVQIINEIVRFEIAATDYARSVAPERTYAEAELTVRREHALQETLREALFLNNRDAAREPIRDAANRLGVQIDETTNDWMALAHETTRVMMDLSKERAQRAQGVFSSPSRFFETALATYETQSAEATQARPKTSTALTVPALVSEGQQPAISPASTNTHHSVPEQTEPPANKLAFGASITLSEAFKEYGKVRLEGKMGKRVNETAVESKGASYERNSFANLKSTAKLIVDVIGNKQVGDLTEKDFTDAFSIIQRVPANHGKSSTEKRSIREIVEATDLKEQKNKARVHTQLKKSGASLGNIEAAEHQETIPRLRVNTVYRHMQNTQRVLRYLVVHK